jgi:hypothetical protein
VSFTTHRLHLEQSKAGPHDSAKGTNPLHNLTSNAFAFAVAVGYCVTALSTLCLIGLFLSSEFVTMEGMQYIKLKGLALLALAVAAFLVPFALSADWLSTTTWLAMSCVVFAVFVLCFGCVFVHYGRKIRKCVCCRPTPAYSRGSVVRDLNGSVVYISVRTYKDELKCDSEADPRNVVRSRNFSLFCMLLFVVSLALAANALRMATGDEPSPEQGSGST